LVSASIAGDISPTWAQWIPSCKFRATYIQWNDKQCERFGAEISGTILSLIAVLNGNETAAAI